MNNAAAPASILVVDDMPANIQTVGTLLSTMGFDVMSATSADQALHRLAARQPDLLLLDMMMPGVSGLDLCRRLKATPEWEEIPVIFLSAAGEVPLITAALDAGAVDYVTKPFHRAELLSRIRTHLDLKSARDQLRQAAADREELLGLIAHDFKNHLAAMQVHAGFVAGQADTLPAGVAGSAEIIARESARMARWVNELLANESAGRHGVRIAAVCAAAIATDAVEAIRPLAAAKGQTVRLSLPAADPVVAADPAALRQVLDNLLSNAVKFSPRGGRIGLTVSAADGRVCIAVRDSGPGFSKADRERAGERYVRLSARPTEGEVSAGLGLNIVKRLTALMHGTLTIAAGAGGGCTVLLPAADGSRDGSRDGPAA